MFDVYFQQMLTKIKLYDSWNEMAFQVTAVKNLKMVS